MHVHPTCLLKRHSLAAGLFACSLQIVIVVRYFERISQIEHGITGQYLPYFGATSPSPLPTVSLPTHTHALLAFHWTRLDIGGYFWGTQAFSWGFCPHANRFYVTKNMTSLGG